MKRELQSVLVGALMATSLTVTPAMAESDKLGRVLLGVAGIAALGALLDQPNTQVTVQSRGVRPGLAKRKAYQSRRHLRQSVDYQQCLRQRWTQSGWQSYVSNRCVNRLNTQAFEGPRGSGHRFHPNSRRSSRR